MAINSVQDLLSLCHSLGIVLKKELSDLVPLAPATYLGVSFDIGPARIFLPLCGGRYFLLVAKGFIASSHPHSAWQVLFCSCLRWKTLFRPVVFTCVLCVALVDSLASQVSSSLGPRRRCLCPGRLGRSLFVLCVKLSYCGVLRLESPAPILHRFSDSSPSSWGYRLLVCSRLRGVFVARAGVPHLASRFAGIVFDLPSFPIGVTVFVCP